MNPGDGERRAMIGFVPQYRIAASKILDSILNGTLEWIRVADPDAGTVDDIQIACDGRVDAYQVKWSEFVKDEFSYNDFIRMESSSKSADLKPGLFQQLVKGWTDLSTQHPEKKVFVHLIHRQVPSPSIKAKLPVGSETPKNNHFQGFLNECWFDRSWCKEGLDHAPKQWTEVIRDLQAKSGLSKESFLEFVSCCELEFNYQHADLDDNGTQQNSSRSADLADVYKLIMDLVGGERRIIELSKDQLLEKLHWKNRFEYNFIHEFPNSSIHYSPITDTVHKLEKSLSAITRGYIALLGTPGSGKSTTLTQTLKYKKGYRLVRYYAFVPDTPVQMRGEASRFLHDITLSLKSFGFSRSATNTTKTRDEYLSLLGDQLNEAHLQWQNDNIVTIIMVDGLDHIQREQKPERTLLSDLPLPESVPDGVVLILGSQTLELDGLSDAIKLGIMENDLRTIQMGMLNRHDVYTIIERWFEGDATPTEEEKSIIYRKSSGHPLSLAYILNALRNKTEVSFRSLLETLPDYEGTIEKNYRLYWEKIKNNLSLVELLALLSRLRIPINTGEIAKWADQATLKDFIEGASQYFRKENKNRWHFFHNSFRQYILQATSTDLFGNQTEELSMQFHSRIADECLKVDKSSQLRAEYLYHLFSAKRYQEVVDVGRQEYFRQQFFQLRHKEVIFEDITNVILSSREINSPLAFIRCMLIENEISERQQSLDQIELLDAVFFASGIDAAMGYILDAHQLRVSEETALVFVKRLIEYNHINEAHIIFEAAEPLDNLSGNKGVGHGGQDVLYLWIDVAHYFVDLQVILETIPQIQYDSVSLLHGSEQGLHFDLISRLIESLVRGRKDKEIERLFELGQSGLYEDISLEVSIELGLRYSDYSGIQKAQEIIQNWLENENLSNSERIVAAEILYKLHSTEDEILQIMKKSEQPAWAKDLWGYENDLNAFIDQIRYYRIQAAIGKNIDPVEVVSGDGRDEREMNKVYFERQVIKFSIVWGKGWRKEKIDTGMMSREMISTFLLFLERQGKLEWHQYERMAVSFFKFVIEAYKAHGDEILNTLAKAFFSSWKERFWPTSWRLEILEHLWHKGCSFDSIVSSLRDVEKDISLEEDVHTKSSEYAKLAILYGKIGEREKAKALLPEILKNTFGIYSDKDYRFGRWVRWLGKISYYKTDTLQGDINRFASALVSLETNHRGGDIQEAGEKLVEIVTALNTEFGFQLVNWLFDQKGIHFIHGIIGLVLGMLRRDNPPLEEIVRFVNTILIPFEQYHPSEVPEKIAFACFQQRSEIDAVDLISSVNRSIRTHQLPSNRNRWLNGIYRGALKAGYAKIGELLKSVPDDKDNLTEHSSKLILNNEEKLSQDEIELRVDSWDSLYGLLKEAKKDVGINWLKIVESFIYQISQNKLEAIYDLFSNLNSDLKIRSFLAGQFRRFGDTRNAEKLLVELLPLTNPRDWIGYYHGARPLIYKELVSIDPAKWRSVAMQDLIENYLGEFRYPGDLMTGLDEIVAVLFEGSDIVSVWQEIREHAYQLNDFNDEATVPPNYVPGNSSTSDVDHLIRFVFRLLDLPVFELAERSHQAIVGFISLNFNRTVCKEEIQSRLNSKGLVCIKALSILESVGKNEPEYLKAFQEQIYDLSSHDDLSIRIAAQILADQLNIEYKPKSPERFLLPFSYEIELPAIEFSHDSILSSDTRPGQSLPEFDSPWEMTRTVEFEMKLLSKFSGIPLQNIIERTYSLMKSISSKELWKKSAEDQIRRWLNGIDLHLTYQRPRPQIAREAVAYVSGELWDAGKIPEKHAAFMAVMLRRSDNLLLSIEPDEQPSYISLPGAKSISASGNIKAWLQNVRESISCFSGRDDRQWYIVGEYTKWSANSRSANEERLSMVCHPEIHNKKEIDSRYNFFPNQSFISACDYPRFDNDDPSLVVSNYLVRIDHGRTEWLAFNPTIARDLRWVYSEDGLFRWVNKQGEIMAETFFWKNGPVDRRTYQEEDVCSEGWLVLVSPEAVNQILHLTGEPTIKLNAVIRSYYDTELNDRIFESIINRQKWM